MKATLVRNEYTQASKSMMSDGQTSVEEEFTQIATKIGTEIKYLNITGTTGTGQGAGNLVVYKSSYPNVKCLIPIGVSGAQYRAQLTTNASNYWVISVNNATTGAWADNVNVTVLAVAVMS